VGPADHREKEEKEKGVPAGPAWLLGRGSKVASGKEIGASVRLG
jgi:hypothetical protein